MGTRQKAIAEGKIIEVDRNVRWDAGFEWEIAMTADVYEDLVKWDESDNDKVETPMTEQERLWDLVHAAAECIRLGERHTNRLTFDIYTVNRSNESFEHTRNTVILIGHPDDRGEPCLTIRYPFPDTLEV